MRVNTRHLLVDSAIALVLGWICFWGAHVFWGPGPVGRSIPARLDRSSDRRGSSSPRWPTGWRCRCCSWSSAWPSVGSGRGRPSSPSWWASAATWPPVPCSRRSSWRRRWASTRWRSPCPCPLGAADRAAGADDHGRPLVGALSRVGQPRAVRRTGGGRRRGRGAGHGRAAPPQPPGERPAPTRAGPAPIRVRGAAADRPGCARRGRPQPVGDHHAGRRRPARAGQAPRPGGGVAGGDPDDQSRGPGGTADDPGGLPGSGGRRGPGSGAGTGPARRPGRGPAPGGPDGRGGAGTGR